MKDYLAVFVLIVFGVLFAFWLYSYNNLWEQDNSDLRAFYRAIAEDGSYFFGIKLLFPLSIFGFETFQFLAVLWPAILFPALIYISSGNIRLAMLLLVLPFILNLWQNQAQLLAIFVFSVALIIRKKHHDTSFALFLLVATIQRWGGVLGLLWMAAEFIKEKKIKSRREFNWEILLALLMFQIAVLSQIGELSFGRLLMISVFMPITCYMAVSLKNMEHRFFVFFMVAASMFPNTGFRVLMSVVWFAIFFLAIEGVKKHCRHKGR